MREIESKIITDTIAEMCIEANHYLTPDMEKALDDAVSNEISPLGKQVLCQLKENLSIAGSDNIPICQDTGMAVVFAEIGQDVHFTGGLLENAINEGVRNNPTLGQYPRVLIPLFSFQWFPWLWAQSSTTFKLYLPAISKIAVISQLWPNR